MEVRARGTGAFVHDAGDEATGWYAKVMLLGGQYWTSVYDADGDLRPDLEMVGQRGEMLAYADSVVLTCGSNMNHCAASGHP